MLKRLSLCLLFGAFLAPAVYAQTSTVSGTVLDSRTGDPIPGANIFITEIARGAAANIDGEFAIANVPYGTYTFRVTFIGYADAVQTVDINQAQTNLQFELNEDFVGLGEVIVTGQGSGIKKDRLSTTVDVVSAKKLSQLPSVQLDQLLQANLPNSQIRLSSGQPGTASIVRGRGVTSALTSTTPVIYIDGVRVDNTSGFAIDAGTGGAESSAIADIPIENIERIEFVKGGAATTQFGSDAANGVLQIFTKKGVTGASQFSFVTTLGASVGTEDYLKYKETADIMFRPGLVQKYQLTGSGGTDKMTYSFSGSLNGDEGFRDANNQVRHELRAGFTAELNDYVKYSGSMGFTSSEFERDYNANTSASSFGNLETGAYGPLTALSKSDISDLKKEIGEITSLVDISEDIKRFQSSNMLNFAIADGLEASALVGLDYRNSGQLMRDTNAWQIAMGFEPVGTTDKGYMRQSNRNFLGITMEAKASYAKDFGDISTITNLGAQLFRNGERSIAAISNGLPDGSYNISSGDDLSATSFERVVVNYGIYLLENISYKDKYVLELGVRADKNTAFGETVDAQIYPKAGVVYNISSEDFFATAVPSNIVSTLRLRANYGLAGNFPRPFSNQVMAAVGSFLSGGYLEFGTPGDIALKPEKTETIEIGGDISFINDRLNFGVTYYTAQTTDALFSAPFAPSYGLGTALQNLGKIENKGLEISGNFGIVRQRDFNLNLNASFNTLSNKVVDNGNSAPFSVGGFAFLGSYVDEGKPVGYFRGGIPTFAADGTIASVENNADLGSPIPDYFGSISLDAAYKNLSLTVVSDYQLGAQGVNVDEVLRFAGGLHDSRVPDASSIANGGNFFDLASLWVEDTDYLKIRLIALNYNLPATFLNNYVRGVRLGVSVSNPFNFYSSGFDPEVTGAGISDGQGGLGVGGFGFGTESSPRHYLGTIKIDF